MRRPKPHPKDTCVLRLRNAKVPKRPSSFAQENKDRKSPTVVAPRLTRGRTYRLRKVHRD